MFKKLRRKIIWMSTAILFLVVTAVLAIMYQISSRTIMSQTRILMEEILDNDGDLPGQWDYDLDQRPYLALNQESIYEIRYYTALIKGEDMHIDDMHIAINEKEAESIAESISQKNSDYGSVSVSGNRVMNYMKKINTDGSMFIVILDSTTRYAIIRVITMYLCALWLTVLMLYVIIMWNYSKKLVRPFIENDEKQKRFITNASHELKTPLAVISSNTEMMETIGGKSKWTDSTRRQVTKLQSLIEDLVVLSRLDEMQEPALSQTDLSVETAETVESFRGVIEGSGRRLVTDIEQNVVAMSEKRSFRQLISILMDNAAKYCDAEGEVCVSLLQQSRGKGAKITISNTYAEGKNVDYSRFFERFYRADTSHNSSTAGFGIGLSMGKEIAERLGGKLAVEYSGDTIKFSFERI